MLRAPVAYEVVRGRLMRLETFDAAAANRLLAEMRAEAEAIVRRGAPDAALTERRSALMRYRGQGHEITVELPVRDFTAADRATMRKLFEEAYSRLYSRHIPGVEIEILSWVVAIAAPAEGELAVAGRNEIERSQSRTRGGRYSIRRAANFWTCRSIGGRIWRPARIIRGPAVIAEDDTSTVVSPLFDARIDRFGYIELTRRET